MTQYRRGNSFEFATFLTSLLLGQGYNAYVVSGYATREQVRCDRSRTPCSYLPEPKEVEKEEKFTDDVTYKLRPAVDLRSQYLLKMEAREKARIEAELQRQHEERLRAIAEFEKPPPDKYYGHRHHAWVLILPPVVGRDVNEEGGVRKPFFIEPSTGEVYELDDEQTNNLYLGIESIWNDKNYWVNMQKDPNMSFEQLDWDLTVKELWEHLLPGEPWTMRGVEDDVTEEDILLDQEKHLDMPFSYVKEIEIDNEDFERRYPYGQKTIFFKKVMVDLYSPYSRTDGALMRITIYEDYDYIVATEVQETYQNRSDYLISSQKILSTGYVIDCYKRGRLDACKEHHYFAHSHNAVDDERTLNFYDVVRLDGLSQLLMYPFCLIQHYIGRDDRLCYREVEFAPEKKDVALEGIHCRAIQRIIEKYDRNEAIPASKDVAIREFAIAENEISLKFHYEEGRATRAIRTYAKPEIGESINVHTDVIEAYNPNALAPPEKNLYLYYELEHLLEEEDRCTTHVRDAEKEVLAFINLRTSEYSNPTLVISPFDRNRIAEAGKSLQDSQSVSQSQRDLAPTVDYLAPYFARIGNPKHISRAQAYIIREDCLNDFKEIQVEKANLILRTFNSLMEELDSIQVALTQNEDLTREEKEQMMDQSNEINFNMQLLEMKLNHHKDLVHIRYKTLIESIQRDERFAGLYKY